MAEDFHKLLLFEMKQRKIAGPVSPIAALMCDLWTRHEQHTAQSISDAEATANRAYAKALELERLVKGNQGV